MGFLYCLNTSTIRHQHLLCFFKIQLTTEQEHYIALAIDQLESNSNRSNTEEIAFHLWAMRPVYQPILASTPTALPQYGNRDRMPKLVP